MLVMSHSVMKYYNKVYIRPRYGPESVLAATCGNYCNLPV